MVEKIHSTPYFDGILQKEWFQYTIASYGCIKNMMQRMVEKIVCIFYTNLWYSGTSQIGPSDKGTVYYIPLHNEQN